MVAYFKRLNNLFMLAGVIIALLVAFPFLNSHFSSMSPWTAGFAIIIIVIFGIIAGRIFSSFWSNRRLRQIDALLYQQNDPKAFIARFEPLVIKAPETTVEYVNGYIKIAYAYEALGEFTKALDVLKKTNPEGLKLHALQTLALSTNQKMKLHLLMEDTDGAAAYLQDLYKIQENAQVRVPTLASNLKECIHLGEIWMAILSGEAGEQKYLKEEISLAKNDIHKNEMRILLAKSCLNAGERAEARKLLEEAAAGRQDFYSTQKANELLKQFQA